MTIHRGPASEPVFTTQEVQSLMGVKPTPYMDEADLPDPSWVLPVDTVASQASADAAYLTFYFEQLFGKESG
jgi:hypothetical protein